MAGTIGDGIMIVDRHMEPSPGVSTEKPFDRLLNFRDVGKTINGFLGEKRVAERKIYRSARPEDASLLDRKRLKDEYGIKTIIDLRTATEHGLSRKKREQDLANPLKAELNDALNEPMQIPGILYRQINLNGRSFELGLLWKLSTSSLARFFWLILTGYRMEAISILGKEVMQPSGLAGLGKDSLDYCGTEITEILEIFAEPISYPILIHCTQGKDRTGLIITILLLLLDVPVEAIDFDYRMSEEELRPEHAARMAEISSIGLTEEFALCPAGWVSSIDQYLKNRFGGVIMYLRLIGVSAESEAPIVRVLRGDDGERMDGESRE